MDVRGVTKRLIEPPGYHIQPQYDLKFLRERINRSSQKDFDTALPLTSMIDMFSMLVIFLLLNFSATGEAFFVNKDVKLPKAENAQPLKSLPLISIVQGRVSLDTINNRRGGLGSFPVDGDLLAFKSALLQLKQMDAELFKAGLSPKPGVNLQADLNTPVEQIKKVMNAIVESGISGINFAVREDQ